MKYQVRMRLLAAPPKTMEHNGSQLCDHPVDDARGNAEAILEIQKMGVRLGIK